MNLVSDVEVAISLSSGTDSTLLLKLARRFQKKIRAFTFGFDEQKYDEVRRIRKHPDMADIRLYPVYLKKRNLLKELKESVYYFETPVGGLGTLSAYNMMKEVRRQKIKVMLSGEGSDEVFGGYKYYYYAFFKDIENNISFLNRELLAYSRKHGIDIKEISKEYDELYRAMSSNSVFAPDATGSISSHASKFLKKYISTVKQNTFRVFAGKLKEMMYNDLTVKKLPKLLHFQDRASMASSVETRVPFLDHQLVEYLYTLGPEYKIKNGKNKYLLRKILQEKYKYREQKEVKHYVATPQREWLKDKDIRNQILDTVKNGKLSGNNFIDYKKFEKDYMDYSKSPDLGNSFFVWKVINLEYLLEYKWI